MSARAGPSSLHRRLCSWTRHPPSRLDLCNLCYVIGWAPTVGRLGVVVSLFLCCLVGAQGRRRVCSRSLMEGLVLVYRVLHVCGCVDDLGTCAEMEGRNAQPGSRKGSRTVRFVSPPCELGSPAETAADRFLRRPAEAVWLCGERRRDGMIWPPQAVTLNLQ